MPANYVLLERVELNASAASVTFANIPQSGYTDLKVVISSRITDPDAGALVYLRPNGLTTNQTLKRLRGTGTAASSASSTIIYSDTDGAYNTANTFGNCEFYIPNYTSSDYKSISGDGVGENNATESYMIMTASLWSSTSAITSLSFFPSGSSNFVQYSTFSLYGLAAVGTSPAIAPKASGGNVITTDGTYWYHTFLSSGFFTPISSLTCDYLVVAGGGGGGPSNSVGSRGGGGGGAGGYRYFTSQSLTANTTYTATIGAGGANYTQGATSSFNSSSSTGGGYGGTSDVGGANSGGSGGSGGGAGQHPGTRNGGAGNAGGYTPVEGYAGTAITTDAPPYGGAPGGGSSGTASYTNPPTTPTNGTSNSISGSAVTYAVGGRGGLGDVEGAAATAGGANTGNGGQGGPGKSSPYQNSPGGAGGSGIVIIRYAV
jgi:hypothetical protein